MPASVAVVAAVGSAAAASVRRACAVAGLDVVIASDRVAVARVWRSSTAVVVSASSGAWADGLPRRRSVVVFDDAAGNDQLEPWQLAVRLGAEAVFAAERDGRELLDWLALAAEPATEPADVIAVAGACGGAGASTFAAAVALQAAANETVTLVDADPIGGGLDLLLGAEAVPGARWADLGDCRGVVAAAALTATLPVVGGMTLLSFGRGAARVLPDAMEAVLAAAARGSDLVVVDLPRGPDAAAERVAGAAALVVLVVPATVRAVAAAGPSIERWSAGGAEMALAVRHPGPADLTPAAVASAVGLPLLTVVPGDRRLADLTDRGRFVHGLHRSPVAAAAAAVVRTRRSAIAA